MLLIKLYNINPEADESSDDEYSAGSVANGEYRDDSEIGNLMHDFSCWDPEDMKIDLLKETTKYYKEDPKGVAIMCRAFEEVRDQARAEGKIEGRAEGRAEGREQTQIDNIQKIMEKLKISVQQAMDMLEIPATDRERLSAKISS